MKYGKISEDIHLLELFNFGIFVLDEDLIVNYWNSWLAFATKVSSEDILEKNLTDFFPAINISKLKRQINAANIIGIPTYFTSRDGYLFQISLDEITNPIYDYMQQLITIYPLPHKKVLITIDDQTSLKEANNRVKDFSIIEEEQKKLIIDKLTTLPNRNRLLQQIQVDTNKKLAFLNVDGFTDINDFYGFAIGDKYLIDIANKINEFIKNYELTLYKFPSDEYAVYSANNNKISNEIFEDIIIKLVNKLNNSFYNDGDNKIAIFMSSGISFIDDNILKTCDVAIKHARKLNRKLTVYDETISIEKKLAETYRKLHIFKEALEFNRMKTYYQPIYNIKTKKIEKYETLIRVLDKDGKVIEPFYFLDVAKKAKLYNEVTSYVIKESFKTFKDVDYEFSINISVEDIEHEPTVELLLLTLKNNPDISKRLVIELLEDEGIQNFELVNTFIKNVRKYGAKIAIDDFGTGYSNFSYLLELKVDYLKIDASLIKNIHTDINSKKIVETLVDFGKKIDVKIIAEFVNNERVLEEITKLGIDYAQGFYIDLPRSTIGNEPIWINE